MQKAELSQLIMEHAELAQRLDEIAQQPELAQQPPTQSYTSRFPSEVGTREERLEGSMPTSFVRIGPDGTLLRWVGLELEEQIKSQRLGEELTLEEDPSKKKTKPRNREKVLWESKERIVRTMLHKSHPNATENERVILSLTDMIQMIQMIGSGGEQRYTIVYALLIAVIKKLSSLDHYGMLLKVLNITKTFIEKHSQLPRGKAALDYINNLITTYKAKVAPIEQKYQGLMDKTLAMKDPTNESLLLIIDEMIQFLQDNMNKFSNTRVYKRYRKDLVDEKKRIEGS